MCRPKIKKNYAFVARAASFPDTVELITRTRGIIKQYNSIRNLSYRAKLRATGTPSKRFNYER